MQCRVNLIKRHQSSEDDLTDPDITDPEITRHRHLTGLSRLYKVNA